MICCSLCGKTIRENLDIAGHYKENYDVLELRVDFLREKEYEKLPYVPQMFSMPLILTIRRKQDGGQWGGTEENRRKLIRAALHAEKPYAYLDIESDVDWPDVETVAWNKNMRIIRSFHDCNGTPADLSDRIKKIAHHNQEITKVVVTPNNTIDLYKILECYRTSSSLIVEKILLAMGPFGFPIRILTKQFGSYLTFTSATDRSAAPGHINPETMNTLYHYHRVNANTKVYGIIGNPVLHSKSPAIHNPAYRKQRLNAVYVPFHIDDAEIFCKIAKYLPIHGFSVTIPHKEGIIPFLDSIDDTVRQVGACNTVVNKEGFLYGTNTDVSGFMKPLNRILPSSQCKQKKATVIGAGGAARSVIYALKQAGMEVLVINRTTEKAEKLACQFSCSWGPLVPSSTEMMNEYNDVIVQTTNVGMDSNTKDPIPFYPFKGHEIVYDIIYTPKMTPFLQRARKSTCTIITGDQMLDTQGKLQYELFTGKKYPDLG